MYGNPVKSVQNYFNIMQKKILPLLLCLGLGFSINCIAQTTANASRSFLPETNQLKEIKAEDWSLYADEENHVYYIDFESLKINLSDIVVKNEDGKVVLKEDVFDLPVNTIYEIDYSDFKSGKYELELRSFTGIIRKTISIK